jgi:hypothetical protein
VHTTKDREASKAKSSREHILKKHFTKHGKMAHGVHPEFKPRYCKKKKKKKSCHAFWFSPLFLYTCNFYVVRFFWQYWGLN